MITTAAVLESRIRRIYAALEATVEQDVAKFPAQQTTFRELGYSGPGCDMPILRLEFSGGVSKEAIENAASSAIHSIAMMYDYCMSWAETNGVPVEEVKSVTKNCLSLRIIRDLYNNEKHPKHRNNTSGVHPKLNVLGRGIRMRTRDGEPTVRAVPGAGIEIHPDAAIDIVGTVTNSETGELVVLLPGLLRDGIQAWETFLSHHGLLSESPTAE